MENKICAIHQPNFFPWLGYFHKIKHSDVFVILDDVQHPKKGGTWLNRVAINVKGEKAWLTAPIVRQSGLWKVNETEFQKSNWRDKLIRTLQVNYAKCSFYNEYSDLIYKLIRFPSDNLVEYNVNAISQICNILLIDFNEKAVYQSGLATNSNATELLIELVKKVDATTYLCGGGADGYQEDEKFLEKGVQLEYQYFQHPEYNQATNENFVSGLSIIDALFNVGAKRVIQMLE